MPGRLASVLTFGPARRTAIAAGAVYLLVYLYAIGDIVLSRDLLAQAPSMQVVDDWTRMFRWRVAFVFEPVAAIFLTDSLAYFFSPMNLLLALVLAVLVGVNFGVLAFALKRPQACGRRSPGGVLASLPPLLLGFACCAPTLLIALGTAAASVAVGFVALRTVFYPVAVVALLVAVWVNVRRVNIQLAARSS